MGGSSHGSRGRDAEPRASFTPLVFVVSAPSGTGKSTLVDGLIEAVPRLRRVVTCTTRPPRGDEQDRVAYYFLDRAEFDARIERGDFVEWNEIYGERYGTSWEAFRKAYDEAARNGEDLVLVIDVDGAENFVAEHGEAVTIFVLPPSFDELRRRLAGRGSEAADSAARRLERAEKEIARADWYRHQVVNDSKERALNELAGIVRSERAARDAPSGVDNPPGCC
jgi:guanylate kinase